MAPHEQRLQNMRDFYHILEELQQKVGGRRVLANCNGRMHWPQRGVYFFFEPGEYRSHSGDGDRIVRVGTHALNPNSRTTLWNRLMQHRGTVHPLGGNHRGSIFRLLVGQSLIQRNGYQDYPHWGMGNNAPSEIRESERPLEREVSQAIGAMPFLWLAVEDAPGPQSLRGCIERNAIAMLSNFHKDAIDPPSENWLGKDCDRETVRLSGLWNSNHVQDGYDPRFLEVMHNAVEQM
ncbi:hypothetical protein [Candidatus Symbiobacter mobilis]|uniref:GIY-YIG domain-containing protein n=1 Tax=Candidatus Symbiobacter mobilis CR TaxID=946483 RepID=U5NDT0_9BURK|nr:hypothetical protein [Candidatus Symbiobacter mobilis]AGX88319.1 hypothetical protein Cenrod_2255 [Candidatus Symbiobacter mobilis CR]